MMLHVKSVTAGDYYIHKGNRHGMSAVDLEAALSDHTFTCGAPLQDLDLPGRLADVYVRYALWQSH